MLDQPEQNLRQRSARLAGSHQVYIERRENPRQLTQGLRKTAAIDQRLMQRVRHLLDARLLQTFSKTDSPSSSVMPAWSKWASCSVKTSN